MASASKKARAASAALDKSVLLPQEVESGFVEYKLHLMEVRRVAAVRSVWTGLCRCCLSPVLLAAAAA